MAKLNFKQPLRQSSMSHDLSQIVLLLLMLKTVLLLKLLFTFRIF